MQPGVLCLFLYEQTGQKKYQLAALTMRNHLVGTPEHPSLYKKTPEGGYWHKSEEKYHNVMSVDGLYMAYPFLVRYAVLFNEPELLDLAAKQIEMVSEHSFNIKSNLVYHAWSYDKVKPWANKITGSASQYWSRATGWYAMALVDVLEKMPKTHPSYPQLLTMFQSLAVGINAAQNPQDGMWYQVVDAYSQPDNYPEVSGSGMIVYALQKGINLGLLDKKYQETSMKGWQGITRYISTDDKRGPVIHSVAPPMSSQNDYAGYVAIRPITVPSESGKDYPHGYIGVLMAAAMMDKIPLSVQKETIK
jgi:unsaturated rhamnogalacturonyl hydrolase